VAIPAPPASVTLGLSPDNVAAEARGFRPDRGITAPTQAFEIQQHEVSWREIRPWLAQHPEHTVTPPAWLPSTGTEDLPATAVPWPVAQAFCQSLGGALPTEEQWEHAARGAERRPYPWGAAPPDPERTHVFRPGLPLSAVMTAAQDVTPPVGGHGLHDMAGNALEWTASLYREDVAGQDESWVDAEGLTFRAVRGLPPTAERPSAMPAEGAAHRDALCATGDCPPATAEILQHVGFRCVRSSR
jgi:formylglycine-generating enzyme required for sulfatase activity